MRNRTTSPLLILDSFLQRFTLILGVLYPFGIVAGIFTTLLIPINVNAKLGPDGSLIQQGAMAKTKVPFSISKPDPVSQQTISTLSRPLITAYIKTERRCVRYETDRSCVRWSKIRYCARWTEKRRCAKWTMQGNCIEKNRKCLEWSKGRECVRWKGLISSPECAEWKTVKPYCLKWGAYD